MPRSLRNSIEPWHPDRSGDKRRRADLSAPRPLHPEKWNLCDHHSLVHDTHCYGYRGISFSRAVVGSLSQLHPQIGPLAAPLWGGRSKDACNFEGTLTLKGHGFGNRCSTGACQPPCGGTPGDTLTSPLRRAVLTTLTQRGRRCILGRAAGSS